MTRRLLIFDNDDSSAVENDSNDTDYILDAINESLTPSEDTGPPVNEKLAALINNKFTTDFDLAKRKEIGEKYPVPKNCTELHVPKVNTEI